MHILQKKALFQSDLVGMIGMPIIPGIRLLTRMMASGMPLLAGMLALWPVWRWYVNRMTDMSDEPWGWLALASSFFFLAREKRVAEEKQKAFSSTFAMLCASVLLLGYAVSYPFCPNLVKAMAALITLGFLFCFWRGHFFPAGIWGLLVLSLPLFSSFQFFLGYPLRRLVAYFSSHWLYLQGFHVGTEGTCLIWGKKWIEIDAACSGIKMLWAGMYLCFTLSTVYRLKPIRVLRIALFSFVIIVFGNVLRASALFYLESNIVSMPSWGHQGIGTSAFLITALLIVALFVTGRPKQIRQTERTEQTRQTERTEQTEQKTENPGSPASFSLLAKPTRWVLAIYLSCCLLAFVSPWLHPWNDSPQSGKFDRFPGFPSSFEGIELIPLPLSPKEEEFYKDFPGHVARFRLQADEIVLRWFDQKTRKVHPASDCFKGLGYTIRPLPLWEDKGRRWGRLLATKNEKRLQVFEILYDTTGKHWSDVSVWYWDAFFQKSDGPWWAVTIVIND